VRRCPPAFDFAYFGDGSLHSRHRAAELGNEDEEVWVRAMFENRKNYAEDGTACAIAIAFLGVGPVARLDSRPLDFKS
jgi:hypothetical protein